MNKVFEVRPGAPLDARLSFMKAPQLPLFQIDRRFFLKRKWSNSNGGLGHGPQRFVKAVFWVWAASQLGPFQSLPGGCEPMPQHVPPVAPHRQCPCRNNSNRPTNFSFATSPPPGGRWSNIRGIITNKLPSSQKIIVGQLFLHGNLQCVAEWTSVESGHSFHHCSALFENGNDTHITQCSPQRLARLHHLLSGMLPP